LGTLKPVAMCILSLLSSFTEQVKYLKFKVTSACSFSIPMGPTVQTKINRVAQEKHDEEEERIMGTNPSLSEAVLVI